MNIMEAISIRRSVRSYKKDSISKEKIDKLLQALRLAPSACNNQPWKFIVVDNSEIIEKLVPACKNQAFIAQAPLLLVGCGYPEQAYKWMGGQGNSIDIDLALALDHLTLVAASEGLGTCWIGAFDEKAVKKILNIPETVKVVALMPIGYPSEAQALKPEPERRKPLEEIICYNSFKE